MAVVRTLREWLVKYDTEHFDNRFEAEPGATPDPSRATAKDWARALNSVDGVWEGINAWVSGTPVGALSGLMAATYGLGKLLAGLKIRKDAQHRSSGNHLIASGIKSLIAGLSASVPGLGHGLNGVLATMDGAQAVNVLVPAPKSESQAPTATEKSA